MKFSKEIQIAVTAIIAIIIIIIGINFFKGINIFKTTNAYYVKFKDIKGLMVTNDVFANGYPVGNVQEIIYNYGNNKEILVRVELNKDMRLPRHTVAELESALMGGVTMNLLLGSNPTDNLEVGDTISGSPKFGAMEQAAAVVPAVVSMLPKVDSILTSLNHLTGNPALQQSLENMAVITHHLKNTTAKMDAMMGKEIPQILGHLHRTSANIERTSTHLTEVDVQHTVKNISHTVQSLQDLSVSLNGTVNDMRTRINSTNNTLGALLNDKQLYNRLNSTVDHADSLMIDLKTNPKRYVHFSIFGRKDKK